MIAPLTAGLIIGSLLHPAASNAADNTLDASAAGKSASFSAKVELPSGTGPFPAVVVYGGFGGDTATIKASGVAVISYDPYAVGKEGTPRTNEQGAFYTLYGATSTTGLLRAWGWGVSRIIDVVATSGADILKADAMGVTGCSRFGKGAYGEQPWFGDAFTSFTGNPNSLPVDTHEMVAMIAPRGLDRHPRPAGDVMTARPNGNGNTFGVTVQHNGNRTWPTVSCRVD